MVDLSVLSDELLELVAGGYGENEDGTCPEGLDPVGSEGECGLDLTASDAGDYPEPNMEESPA